MNIWRGSNRSDFIIYKLPGYSQLNHRFLISQTPSPRHDYTPWKIQAPGPKSSQAIKKLGKEKKIEHTTPNYIIAMQMRLARARSNRLRRPIIKALTL